MQINQPLANECLKLVGFCSRTFDGEVVISGAFDDSAPELSRCSESKHYKFGITIRGKDLVLAVDAYSVANESVVFTAETFDDDAWCDQFIEIVANPISKAAFRLLSSAARGLINGRNVCLFDGTVIPAIVRN